MNRRNWTRDELIIVFRYYCTTPFGKLHSRNPEIIEIAEGINRTASAVAMKACNFASLDPVHKKRNIRALKNTSRADREIWGEFHSDWERLVLESEKAYTRLLGKSTDSDLIDSIKIPDGPSEIERTVNVRRLQGFFRAAVLASYENCCAISGATIPELINASHIIPWRIDKSRRADPSNGIALNVLYDRAFDRGLIAFDNSLRIMVSSKLKLPKVSKIHKLILVDIEGKILREPKRFAPDPDALAYHREEIFVP